MERSPGAENKPPNDTTMYHSALSLSIDKREGYREDTVESANKNVFTSKRCNRSFEGCPTHKPPVPPRRDANSAEKSIEKRPHAYELDHSRPGGYLLPADVAYRRNSLMHHRNSESKKGARSRSSSAHSRRDLTKHQTTPPANIRSHSRSRVKSISMCSEDAPSILSTSAEFIDREQRYLSKQGVAKGLAGTDYNPNSVVLLGGPVTAERLDAKDARSALKKRREEEWRRHADEIERNMAKRRVREEKRSGRAPIVDIKYREVVVDFEVNLDDNHEHEQVNLDLSKFEEAEALARKMVMKSQQAIPSVHSPHKSVLPYTNSEEQFKNWKPRDVLPGAVDDALAVKEDSAGYAIPSHRTTTLSPIVSAHNTSGGVLNESRARDVATPTTPMDLRESGDEHYYTPMTNPAHMMRSRYSVGDRTVTMDSHNVTPVSRQTLRSESMVNLSSVCASPSGHSSQIVNSVKRTVESVDEVLHRMDRDSFLEMETEWKSPQKKVADGLPEFVDHRQSMPAGNIAKEKTTGDRGETSTRASLPTGPVSHVSPAKRLSCNQLSTVDENSPRSTDYATSIYSNLDQEEPSFGVVEDVTQGDASFYENVDQQEDEKVVLSPEKKSDLSMPRALGSMLQAEMGLNGTLDRLSEHLEKVERVQELEVGVDKPTRDSETQMEVNSQSFQEVQAGPAIDSSETHVSHARDSSSKPPAALNASRLSDFTGLNRMLDGIEIDPDASLIDVRPIQEPVEVGPEPVREEPIPEIVTETGADERPVSGSEVASGSGSTKEADPTETNVSMSDQKEKAVPVAVVKKGLSSEERTLLAVGRHLRMLIKSVNTRKTLLKMKNKLTPGVINLKERMRDIDAYAQRKQAKAHQWIEEGKTEEYVKGKTHNLTVSFQFLEDDLKSISMLLDEKKKTPTPRLSQGAPISFSGRKSIGTSVTPRSSLTPVPVVASSGDDFNDWTSLSARSLRKKRDSLMEKDQRMSQEIQKKIDIDEKRSLTAQIQNIEKVSQERRELADKLSTSTVSNDLAEKGEAVTTPRRLGVEPLDFTQLSDAPQTRIDNSVNPEPIVPVVDSFIASQAAELVADATQDASLLEAVVPPVVASLSPYSAEGTTVAEEGTTVAGEGSTVAEEGSTVSSGSVEEMVKLPSSMESTSGESSRIEGESIGSKDEQDELLSNISSVSTVVPSPVKSVSSLPPEEPFPPMTAGDTVVAPPLADSQPITAENDVQTSPTSGELMSALDTSSGLSELDSASSIRSSLSSSKEENDARLLEEAGEAELYTSTETLKDEVEGEKGVSEGRIEKKEEEEKKDDFEFTFSLEDTLDSTLLNLNPKLSDVPGADEPPRSEATTPRAAGSPQSSRSSLSNSELELSRRSTTGYAADVSAVDNRLSDIMAKSAPSSGDRYKLNDSILEDSILEDIIGRTSGAGLSTCITPTSSHRSSSTESTTKSPLDRFNAVFPKSPRTSTGSVSSPRLSGSPSMRAAGEKVPTTSDFGLLDLSLNSTCDDLMSYQPPVSLIGDAVREKLKKNAEEEKRQAELLVKFMDEAVSSGIWKRKVIRQACDLVWAERVEKGAVEQVDAFFDFDSLVERMRTPDVLDDTRHQQITDEERAFILFEVLEIGAEIWPTEELSKKQAEEKKRWLNLPRVSKYSRVVPPSKLTKEGFVDICLKQLTELQGRYPYLDRLNKNANLDFPRKLAFQRILDEHSTWLEAEIRENVRRIEQRLADEATDDIERQVVMEQIRAESERSLDSHRDSLRSSLSRLSWLVTGRESVAPSPDNRVEQQEEERRPSLGSLPASPRKVKAGSSN